MIETLVKSFFRPLRFNRTVEILLVYHTYHTPYLILPFPSKVFSVVGDLHAAGDGHRRPTPDVGNPHSAPYLRPAAATGNFLSLPLSLSSLLSRGDPPSDPPTTGPSPGRLAAGDPLLSLFPFLSILLSLFPSLSSPFSLFSSLLPPPTPAPS